MCKAFAIQKHKNEDALILCNWLATSTKTRGGGGYAKLKLKLELIATSIQSLETTQGDYESAK